MRRARGIARLRALEAQLMAKGTTAPCDVLEEHSGIPCRRCRDCAEHLAAALEAVYKRQPGRSRGRLVMPAWLDEWYRKGE